MQQCCNNIFGCVTLLPVYLLYQSQTKTLQQHENFNN